MLKCILELIAYQRLPIQVNMYQHDGLLYTEQEQNMEKDCFVFSDLSYEANLKLSENKLIENLEFYINDQLYNISLVNSNKIIFNDDSYGNRPFLECYGFVQFTVILNCKDETIIFKSKYLPVLVPRAKNNVSIKHMAEYVYNHAEDLLYTKQVMSRTFMGLKNSQFRSLESRLYLLNEITTQYDKEFSYFKVNGRFKTITKDFVDKLEKVKFINPKTIQFISQHPEQLERVQFNSGIKFNNGYYQPIKTLISENMPTYNIYENQIIVGFLLFLFNEVSSMINQISKLIDTIPNMIDEVEGYVFSAIYIYAQTKNLLLENLNTIKVQQNRISTLYNLYKTALRVSIVVVERAPRPTPILLGIPEYKRLYDCMIKWFDFGIFDLSKEKYILSFLKSSKLYECYLLTVLIQFLNSKGSGIDSLKKIERIRYAIPSKLFYEDSGCNNKYIFAIGSKQISLYFQPVIYSDFRSMEYGIGIYRNTSFTYSKYAASSAYHKGGYYTPDYVVKIENNGINTYIIIDAKYSNIKVVKKYAVPELIFKYLFSIGTLSENDRFCGLCIINGQSEEGDQYLDIYDCKMTSKILPFADLLTLVANGEDAEKKHFKFLNMLFEKYINEA